MLVHADKPSEVLCVLCSFPCVNLLFLRNIQLAKLQSNQYHLTSSAKSLGDLNSPQLLSRAEVSIVLEDPKFIQLWITVLFFTVCHVAPGQSQTSSGWDKNHKDQPPRLQDFYLLYYITDTLCVPFVDSINKASNDLANIWGREEKNLISAFQVMHCDRQPHPYLFWVGHLHHVWLLWRLQVLGILMKTN